MEMINSFRPSHTIWRHTTFFDIGPSNGLPPVRGLVIISANDGLLSTGTLGTNFCEI